jgi:hypothetical protein
MRRPALRRARTFLGATLLATAFALSIPGVEVVAAAGCDAKAQSCDGATRAAAPAAPAAAGCPAADQAFLATHEAALARVQRELAAQAPAGAVQLIPLNGRGYNYDSPPDDGGSSVLRFEAPPAQPAR